MKFGILNLLKPPGMSSHDVVDQVRQLVPPHTKVGHAGTLDPAAAGVLLVCVGAATRLIEYLAEAEKTYRAEICLGIGTDTLDAEGRIVAEGDASHLTQAQAAEAVAAIVGEQMMVPPMHSAARVGGQRLYKLARKNKEIERPPRKVVIYSSTLARFKPGPHATLLVDIRCSKGTYIRVLAAQIGERLGVPAHLSFLVRTKVGQQMLLDSVTLEELGQAHCREGLEGLAVPVAAALGHLPALYADRQTLRAFRHGLPSPIQGHKPGLVRVHGLEGRLEGIGEVKNENEQTMLQPKKVLTL